MILKINTWQRVMLVILLGALQGISLATIRRANELLDHLEFSEEEREQVSLVQLPAGDYEWSRTAGDHFFEVEIEDKFTSLLKQAFTQYEGWSMKNRDLIEDLARQLGLED